MKRILALCAFAGTIVPAQTVESIPFRAVLSPANEVPAIAIEASGVGTVWLHIVRDSTGKIISGSADFIASYQFPGAITLTGMHVHRGAAGANGPVVIDSALKTTEDATGRAGLNLQGQILPDNPTALSAATDMLVNPAGFYFNIHTSANPSGAIRGQLERAQQRVFMGLMSPANENPPITEKNLSAVGTVTVLYTTRADYALTSASVVFDVNYTGFQSEGSFTGLHVHRGPAGVNGPVTLDSGLQGGANALPIPASGTGNLRFATEVSMTNVNALDTLYGMLANPANYYINVHTTTAPPGMARAQLRNTDQMTFTPSLVTSNEVPPLTGLNASAPSRFTIWSIRDNESKIQAASVAFDVNHRFPGETTFTGLHIHNGAAGANGPVTVDSRITASANVPSATGFGNIYRQVTISNETGIATLNAILTNPESAYMNLHTSVNPGGAVRDQVAPANTGGPQINAVISAVSDPAFSTIGRGGLFNIYGANLARVAANFASVNAPGQLNGTRVVIGNQLAPIIGVAPHVITAQVPFELGGVENVGVFVITPSGTSNTMILSSIGNVAPAAFLSGLLDGSRNIALAFKLADSTFVTASNPVAAGENVLLFTTGLGQTNPPLSTGFAAAPNSVTAAPTVMLGGQPATVVSAQATPGTVGMYQIVFTVPTGTGSGAHLLQVSMTGATANTVVLPVR